MSRLLGYIAQNIRRHALLTLGAIFVVMLVSFFFMTLDGIGFLVNSQLKDVEEKVDYTIFLKPEANVDDSLVLELRKEIELLPATVTPISKERAKQELQDIPALADVIGEVMSFVTSYSGDVLPATLIVRDLGNTDPDRIAAIVSKPKYARIIDQDGFFAEQEARIETVSSFNASTLTMYYALYVFFGLVAILIIFNTIRILIFSRRQEIEIMELVGAPKNFIRLPFFGESFVYGTVGALLGFVLFTFLLWQGNSATLFGAELVSHFTANWYLELLKMIVLFVLVAFISTYLALSKHLPRI